MVTVASWGLFPSEKIVTWLLVTWKMKKCDFKIGPSKNCIQMKGWNFNNSKLLNFIWHDTQLGIVLQVLSKDIDITNISLVKTYSVYIQLHHGKVGSHNVYGKFIIQRFFRSRPSHNPITSSKPLLVYSFTMTTVIVTDHLSCLSYMLENSTGNNWMNWLVTKWSKIKYE